LRGAPIDTVATSASVSVRDDSSPCHATLSPPLRYSASDTRRNSVA
jgi:hypothetical protein